MTRSKHVAPCMDGYFYRAAFISGCFVADRNENEEYTKKKESKWSLEPTNDNVRGVRRRLFKKQGHFTLFCLLFSLSTVARLKIDLITHNIAALLASANVCDKYWFGLRAASMWRCAHEKQQKASHFLWENYSVIIVVMCSLS